MYTGFSKRITELAMQLLELAEGVSRLERDFKELNDWKLKKFCEEMKVRADKALEGGLNSVNDVQQMWDGEKERRALYTLPQRIFVETRSETDSQKCDGPLSEDAERQGYDESSVDRLPEAERVHTGEDSSPEDAAGPQPCASNDLEKHP